MFQLVILAPFPVYDVACQLPVSWPLKLNNKEVLFVSTYTIRTIYYTYNSHMYTYSIRAIYMHIFIYTCIYVHILCDLKKLLHTCTYLPILAYTYILHTYTYTCNIHAYTCTYLQYVHIRSAVCCTYFRKNEVRICTYDVRML